MKVNLLMLMATKHYLQFLIKSFILLLCATLTCCKEDENEARNFMPFNVSVIQDGINTVSISWQEVPNTAFYTIQIFNDSCRQDLLFEKTTNTNNCSFSNLETNQHYYFQLQANNADIALNSNWQKGHFIFKREQILNKPTISGDSVKVSWNRKVTDLSKITLISESVIEATITPEIIENQQIVFKGLTESNYIVRLYIGETAIDEYPFSTNQNIIHQVHLTSNDNLVETLNNCPDGSIILLSPGVYSQGDKEIVINNKSITIKSSSTNDEELPEIHVKRISLKGKIGNFIIKNVSLSGFALGGKSPNEKNDYFIDLNDDFVSADSINIEGCTIHYLNNCAVRGSRGLGQQKVKYIRFSKCEFNDINSNGKNQYELFKLDSLQLEEFHLTDCTIYNTSHGILNNRNNHTPNTHISIENCTINDVGSTNSNPKKYLIELSNNNGTFDFANNIVSNLKGYSTSASYMSKGFSIGNMKSTASNNCFFNMPFTVKKAANWNSDTSNFDDLNPAYSDAEIGNFTINNQELKETSPIIGATKWQRN